MDISFIILTWNSEDHIERCLTSVLDALEGSPFTYEVFIVDNGSADRTKSIIQHFKSLAPNVINPIWLNENRGTTFSRNLALKQADGQYIAILDSDVELRKGVIDLLIHYLKHNPSVGLVSPKLIYSSGKLQKSTDDFPTILTKVLRFFLLKKLEKNEQKTESTSRPKMVDYAISAFWVFSRDVKDRVGLLDENIFYAPEDVDYCLRIWKEGFQILYVPEVESVHHAREISRGFKINRFTLHHIKGLLYFFKKHRYFFSKPDFRSRSWHNKW